MSNDHVDEMIQIFTKMMSLMDHAVIVVVYEVGNGLNVPVKMGTNLQCQRCALDILIELAMMKLAVAPPCISDENGKTHSQVRPN